MAPSTATTPPIITSLSLERSEIPGWISRDLNVSPEKVAMLECNSSNGAVYGTLVRYLAHRAVDITEKPPKFSDRIHSDVSLNTREWPGRLSSVLNPGCPNGWEAYSSDDESADTTIVPDRISYGMGLGWARLLTNPKSTNKNGYSKSQGDEEEEEGPSEEDKEDVEKAMLSVNGVSSSSSSSDGAADANGVAGSGGEDQVIVEHFARGEPEPQNYILTQYRAIVLYAHAPYVLRQLLYEVMEWKADHERRTIKSAPGKYVLYTLKVFSNDNPPRWMCSGLRVARPMESIILQDDMMQEIVNDLKDFLDKSTLKWYQSHGLNHRRNLLFYGPPGSGKTSTIKALAGHFQLKACFLSLSHRGFGDHTFIEALNRIPKPCILCLEDVDVMFNENREKQDQVSTLTFSGLLNAIDGMVSTSGIIMIMTTNFIEKLDDALLRAGRVDRRFHFVMPKQNEIAKMFRTFYPDAPKKLSVEFAEAVFKRKEKQARSIATLQEHFIYTRKEDAEGCVKKLDEFFAAFFPGDNQDKKALFYI